jgi:hypothetical protein
MSTAARPEARLLFDPAGHSFLVPAVPDDPAVHAFAAAARLDVALQPCSLLVGLVGVRPRGRLPEDEPGRWHWSVFSWHDGEQIPPAPPGDARRFPQVPLGLIVEGPSGAVLLGRAFLLDRVASYHVNMMACHAGDANYSARWHDTLVAGFREAIARDPALLAREHGVILATATPVPS